MSRKIEYFLLCEILVLILSLNKWGSLLYVL